MCIHLLSGCNKLELSWAEVMAQIIEPQNIFSCFQSPQQKLMKISQSQRVHNADKMHFMLLLHTGKDTKNQLQ